MNSDKFQRTFQSAGEPCAALMCLANTSEQYYNNRVEQVVGGAFHAHTNNVVQAFRNPNTACSSSKQRPA